MDYLLTVMLYANGPMVTMRVPSCEVGVQWKLAAWKWAERSRLEKWNVSFVCKRAET